MSKAIKIIFSLTILLVLLAVVACTGYTTGATNITDTSARLNVNVECGALGDKTSHCYWYWEWGINSPSENKSPTYGPAIGQTSSSGVALHYDVTGLKPDTTYQYRICGKGDGLTSFVCLGDHSTTPMTFKTKPSPSSNKMTVGLYMANYGQGGVDDGAGATKYMRFDTDFGTSLLQNMKNDGITVDMLVAGPYVSSGVCGLNADSWVNDAVNYYAANTNTTQTPTFEVLNEPGGTWFWGSNALSQSNADCYRNLVQKTYNAFHAKYGSSAPKILATVDGSSGLTWGQRWWTSGSASFVDGIVVHPYGGGDGYSRTDSAAGNRQRVTDAHNLTGKPVYVTEVGWPTALGQPSTGDSQQWSEADQATNLTNFMDWARSTGYVAGVWYFTYHDFGSNNWYGIVRSDGSHKPSYTALKNEALK